MLTFFSGGWGCYAVSRLGLHKVGLYLVALSVGATACQSVGGRTGGSQAPGRPVELQVSADRESFLAVSRPDDAIKLRTKMTSAGTPTDESLLLTVAELSLLGNDLAKARESARQRLKSNFNDVEAMNVLIRAFLSDGKIAEARLMVENAQAVDPRNAATLNLKGLMHYQSEQPVLARESWKQTLKYDPTHIAAMMNLGALYFANRNIDQAGALFEKILAQRPQHLDARAGFALVKFAQGQAEQGRAMLEKIADGSSKSPLVYYNLAVIERDGFQNSAKALAHMEKFVALVSRMPTARRSLENGLQVVSQLRKRIAADKQKLSDADLREMASSPSAVDAGAAGPSAPTASNEGAPRSKEGATSSIMDRDVKSLEDAIK